VEAGGVDAGDRVARGDLARGDIGRGVDAELPRDRQRGEVDVLALDHDLVPGRVVDHLARDVALAALAKGGRQVRRLDPEAGREQLAIARDVGDHRHRAVADALEDHDRALPGPLELEDDGRGVEAAVDRLGDA